MSKISELSDGGSLISSDYLIAVRSGGNVKVRMDQINVDQVDLGDNEFIRLGNSQDLTMVHTSTQSIINQAGIGDLLIQRAGATKLTINASGIDVTGSVTADGLTVDGDITVNDATPSLTLSDTGGTNQKFVVSHNGATSYLTFRNGTNYGALQFLADNGTTTATRQSISSNGDISFYNDAAAQGLFWDSSASALGIGTTSPSSYNSAGDDLVIASTGAGLTIASATNDSGHILFADSTSGTGAYTGFIRYDHTTDSMRFAVNAGVERLRIDNAGNVSFSNSGGIINAIGGDVSLVQGAIGLRINDASSALSPTTASVNNDASVDLGVFNIRFRDLYLSGGVYLGGTGAANKLDDYEEGTWTPAGVGVTLSSSSGTYTKVGRLVTVTWQFIYATTSSGSSASISGLPFTVGTNYNNGGNQGYVNDSAAASIAHITAATTSLYYRTANGGTFLTHADLSGATIRGSMTYMTA